jgi:hypothetical protein
VRESAHGAGSSSAAPQADAFKFDVVTSQAGIAASTGNNNNPPFANADRRRAGA